MAAFTFNGTVVQDVDLMYSQVGNGRIRENTTMIFTDFGMGFTQSVPPTLEYSVAEASDHITSVGIRYGTSGSFASSVTLTETQAADLSELQLQVTAEEVTTDQPYTVNITTTDP